MDDQEEEPKCLETEEGWLKNVLSFSSVYFYFEDIARCRIIEIYDWI